MFPFANGDYRTPGYFLLLSALVAAGPAVAQQRPGGDGSLLRGSVAPDDSRTYRPSGGSIPAGLQAPDAPLFDSASQASNYGRPRPKVDKKARYSGRKAISARKLPPTEPYRTAPASVRAAHTPSPAADAAPPPPSFAAQPAPPPKRRPRVEADPYGALGVQMGSINVKPYLDLQAGYDSNPRRSPTKEGSPVLRGGLGFTAQSDWSRHELTAEATGSYLRFSKTPDADRPEGSGKANLRLDILRDTFANFELRGALSTQRPGSPNVPGATINQPTVASFGATTALTQRFGRTEASVSFLADRRVYGDAELAGGGVSRLSQDNYNAYGVRGRVGHEFTPGVKPFVEVGADVRRRDEPIDSSGFDRDSSGFLARIGSTFEITRTLTGEASAGYARRVYNDNRLPILAGPTLDGRLVWAATPLTTLTLRAATELNETTVAGASGAISHTLSADVSHALLRNLTLGAGLSFNDTQYKGAPITERTWVGALRSEYAFNRLLRMRGSYAYEKLDSSQAGASYNAHILLLGLRLTP
ncbi:MAG: outer membrane beta-barrel protein [Beijerinckiaceae bacterium]|nr:outer membrane beta-barrel protein [Beijerinckiaceae bacterium]